MPGPAVLFWGIVLSAIGFGFFFYGKKQSAVVPMVAGVALMLLPYFISNIYGLLITAGVIMALPYYFRL